MPLPSTEVAADSLRGKVALVTGGSRGIGLAICKELRVRGANVAFCARKTDGVRAAEAELTAADGDASVLGMAADAGDPEAAEQVVAATMRRLGRIDVLVNNVAANPHLGALIDIDASRADKTAQVNQYAMLVWTRHAVNAWMAEHGGSVVNIASAGGLTVEPGIGYYNATKAAMMLMTRQLAHELGPRVRVNAVAPGLVRTGFSRKIWQDREPALAKLLPLGRLGEAGDVARAVSFLAADTSSWITGQTLVVDGGMLASPFAAGF